MKKTFFILTCISLTSLLYAQDSTQTKIRKNEFSFDVTGLFRQFFDPGNSFYLNSGYKPVYYIAYRRYFKHGNLRVGFGGDYSSRDNANGVPFTMPRYKNKSASTDARIGYEFKVDVSKRWQAFYGIDYRLSYLHQQNDEQEIDAQYATGIEKSTTVMALAPVAGIRFKITPRLSLSTETTFAFNWETDKTRLYYTPINPSLTPPRGDVGPTLNSGIYTSYQQPFNLYICLQF